jgi:uncharacterized small protein (DUF1192 family)
MILALSNILGFALAAFLGSKARNLKVNNEALMAANARYSAALDRMVTQNNDLAAQLRIAQASNVALQEEAAHYNQAVLDFEERERRFAAINAEIERQLAELQNHPDAGGVH